MVQVALSILKPAGSVGATVQLTIAPAELPKVMSVMVKPTTQSQYGVTQTEEVQMHPLVVAIPGFIQLAVPLPPLKPMAQSRRGKLHCQYSNQLVV
jgi:hypothetical protein